ncbi:MAG: hypothetical protein ACR2I0_11545, partial [Rhodoferax sp.]
ATLRKQFEAQSANAQSIRAEQAQLLQAAKEFETPVERAEMKAAEARRLAFNERATASAARVDEHNAANAALASANALLGPRTDANNLRAKKLQERADEHNYNLQDWQAQCANRPYDEADALLIRKESPK